MSKNSLSCAVEEDPYEGDKFLESMVRETESILNLEPNLEKVGIVSKKLSGNFLQKIEFPPFLQADKTRLNPRFLKYIRGRNLRGLGRGTSGGRGAFEGFGVSAGYGDSGGRGKFVGSDASRGRGDSAVFGASRGRGDSAAFGNSGRFGASRGRGESGGFEASRGRRSESAEFGSPGVSGESARFAASGGRGGFGAYSRRGASAWLGSSPRNDGPSPEQHQSSETRGSNGSPTAGATSHHQEDYHLDDDQLDNDQFEDDQLDDDMSDYGQTDEDEAHLGGDHIKTLRLMGPDKLWPERVVRDITRIMAANVPAKGFQWKLVSDELKDDYFEELRKLYDIPEGIEGEVKYRFRKIAARGYSRMICNFKKAERDKKPKPKGIKDQDWPAWLEYWKQEDVMKKAEKAKQNRLSEVEGPGTGVSKHFGGSSSTYAKAFKVLKETGKMPTPYDIYIMTKTKDGVCADARTSRINEEVEKRAAEIGDEANLDEIFMEVNPVDKKRRRFGAGSFGTSSLGRSRRPHGSSSTFFTQQEVDELVSQAIMPMAERLKDSEERQKEYEKRMQIMMQQIDSLTQSMLGQGTILQPPPDSS